MLKFDSWPPQPGNVRWTEIVGEQLHWRHHVDSEGFAEDEKRLTLMAQLAGHLIISNMPGDDMEATMRIASELTEGWGQKSRELFIYQFGYGAGLGSPEAIEAELAKL